MSLFFGFNVTTFEMYSASSMKIPVKINFYPFLLFFFVLFFSPAARSQTVYVVDAFGQISIVDLSNCTVTPIVNTPPLWDIAMCPNDTDNIYAVASPPSSATYVINISSGVTTTLLPSWPASVTPAPLYLSSLVCDGQGHLYACDDGSNSFYMYDIATNTWSYLGAVGPYSSGGDLTYYNGQLYLSTNSNEILAITLSPFGYQQVSQMNIGNVWGINTVGIPTPCGIKEQMIACSNSDIYYVDPVTGVCTIKCPFLPISGGIYGATSTVQQPTIIPLTTTVTSNPASCSSPTGSATVTVTSATPPPFTYTWLPTGGSSSAATGLSAGTYTVIIGDNTGCADTTTVTVTTGPGSITATTTSTPATCTGNNGSASATPTSGNAPYTYAWSPTGGTAASATGLAAGNYTVTVTDANGCSGTSVVTVSTTVVPPVGNFSSPPVCIGNTNQFTDASTGNPNSWTWNFGDGSVADTTQNPAHTYSAAGTYSVTLIVTNPNGCSDTIVVPVTVYGLPTAAFAPNSPCAGNNTSLNDGSVSSSADPIVSWNWSMPGGTPASSTSQNASTVYSAPGTHTVTLIVTTQHGCKDTLTQQSLVYNKPVASFVAPDSGCAPLCVNFTDNSTSLDGNITSWNWVFSGASATSSSLQNPQNICYNTPGSYSVSLIVTTQFGCQDTVSLPMVHVYPWPVANFCVAPLIAPTTDPVFNFCDLWSTDVVKWTWYFGDNDSDNVNTDPIHSYSASATANDFYSYNVCIRVENQYGCWDTTCKPVELVPEFTFYIPNTFTPNGDHNNEFFFGKSRGVKDYNIWVFDRWGNLIWDCARSDKNTNWDDDSTTPKQEGLSSACQWDGIVQNGGQDMSGNSRQLAQEDVYVWKVRLTDIFNKEHTYVGHVNIVR